MTRALRVVATTGSEPEAELVIARLSDAGIAESESPRVFYRKDSDAEYILWFGTTLGESATYESSNRSWR